LREKVRDFLAICVIMLGTRAFHCIMTTGTAFQLELFGPFRLVGPDGQRIEIVSKRGMALVALLAMAPGGERTRGWLQGQLWGSRAQAQAQSSLRRELTNLRRAANVNGHDLIGADHNRIWIDLERVQIDARAIDRPPTDFSEAFLEGIDISGEEAFEDWLREQRQVITQRRDQGALRQAQLPSAVIDLDAPVPGFSGRPAIAVLPLNNQTGNATLDYLADGISEELIERLSRLKWLPVIARSASFIYRGAPTPLREIGQALGARYVLDGHIRQSDHSFQLTLNMADVETGYAVLSHTSDLPLQFDRETLDDLILEIVSALDMRIDAAEKTRASRKSESALSVEDLIWRARWHMHRFTKEDSVIAEKLFRDALTLAPNSPEALVQMTFFQVTSIWTQRKPEADMRALRQMAQRAIAADTEDGRAYLYAGMADMWLRKTALALPLFQKAIELNPSLAFAYVQIGCANSLSGNPQAAIAPLKMSLRLAPNDEQSFVALCELALAHLMLGNWDEAIAHADLSLNRRVAYWYAHTLKINALVRCDRIDDARAAAADLRAAKPDFTINLVDWVPFVDGKWNAFIREGLVSAGMHQA
jgi:TolB-like protein